jgi:hypothetical protein
MNPDDFNVTTNPGDVWRVGWAPNPWAWSDWAYADDDRRFNGRWDDQLGRFRTIYTAETLLGCFLEVLAQLRPDMAIEDELDAIVDDDGTGAVFPTADAGVVGFDWLEDRIWARGIQTGTYCYVTHSTSVATLAKTGVFAEFGIAAVDIGTDVLKDPHTRPLTRTVARRVYDVQADGAPAFEGLEFRSRHGDDLRMWAIFERGADGDVPLHVKPRATGPVDPENDDLGAAFEFLGLSWPKET